MTSQKSGERGVKASEGTVEEESRWRKRGNSTNVGGKMLGGTASIYAFWGVDDAQTAGSV